MHMHTMFGGDPKQIGGRIFTSTKFLYTVPTYPTIYGSRVKQTYIYRLPVTVLVTVL